MNVQSERKTKGPCRYDLPLQKDISLSRWRWKKLDLHINFDPGYVPQGCFAMIVPRSSLGSKHGLRLRNTIERIIDEDYHLDIQAMLKTDHIIPHMYEEGDRLLQLIIIPYMTIPGEKNPEEERTGGIGSTGL